MSTEPIRLALIIGSTREGRFGPTVARWFLNQAKQRDDFEVDVVDLAEHDLPTVITTQPTPEGGKALGEVMPRIEAADAFVIVTPEYNHSFPASLKNAIDWHSTQWHAKPVGFVSYGGLSGGLRAVEALRLVFAELHAATVRATVSFHGAWEQFGPDGEPIDPEGCNTAAKYMLDQLGWWATTLREGRERRPYVS
ncbi:NADPH azoreductase [Micromonospora sp. MW-13]|uniref:SaqO n=1 Tax=Micromonospora sp. Tu 6368 TaxID=428986 RepID=C4NYK6_9ACTN|nr:MULTISPECIES: NAD(P)H-dependent oxidoreductase [unclassified Micromonospora]ACP19360.1 SaqO [Micromonospora sp. Tu 6368]MCX4469496.1 NAD(P)H-dependent oxidoreductase [Micromonospora sp. NBC_01655]RGC65135.1 NADPH azoreductase [Micromonospora sp. MW-13]